MKVVSLHEKFCSVRILFTNVTRPYMSHIIGVLTVQCKIKLTARRWKGSPLERYSWYRFYRWCNSCFPIIASNKIILTVNLPLFLANSIDRILLKCRQSVLPLFVGFVCSVTVVFCCCLFTYMYSLSLYSLSLVDSVLVCLRCAVARAEFKVDILALAEYCL